MSRLKSTGRSAGAAHACVANANATSSPWEALRNSMGFSYCMRPSQPTREPVDCNHLHSQFERSARSDSGGFALVHAQPIAMVGAEAGHHRPVLVVERRKLEPDLVAEEAESTAADHAGLADEAAVVIPQFN